MSDAFFLSFVLPIIFLLAGIALLIGAALHWTRTRALLAKARGAVGEVIALEKIPPQQPGGDEFESYESAPSTISGFSPPCSPHSA